MITKVPTLSVTEIQIIANIGGGGLASVPSPPPAVAVAKVTATAATATKTAAVVQSGIDQCQRTVDSAESITVSAALPVTSQFPRHHLL